MLSKFKKSLDYIKLLNDPAKHLNVSIPGSPDAIAEAQRLHAQVYLERGYITPEAVGHDRRMTSQHDTYQHHSVYFTVTDNQSSQPKVIATSRQIHAHPSLGHESFPTLKFVQVYEKSLPAIRDIDPDRIVEISGLAKLRGETPFAPLLLYRKMWQHSLASDHALWLMACDAQVYRNLKSLFQDALTEIGPESYYMGSLVVPAIIDVPKSFDYLNSKSRSLNPIRRQLHRRLSKFFVEGMETK